MRAFALRLRPWFRAPHLGTGPVVLAVILVIGLMGAMAVTPTRQLIEQRDRIAGMEQDLRELRETNQDLDARIGRLKDPDYLEQQARSIGLARPGERAFLVVPPSKGSPDRSKQRERYKPRPAPEKPPSFLEGFLDFLGL